MGQPPVPTVLFGDYEWNKRHSGSTLELDRMSYEERRTLEKEEGWWKRDELHELPLLVRRCTSWEGIEQALDHLL